MEERSKTNKEIYEQKFPIEKVLGNRISCAEAIGYLEALTQYFPSEKKWANPTKGLLMLEIIKDFEMWG